MNEAIMRQLPAKLHDYGPLFITRSSSKSLALCIASYDNKKVHQLVGSAMRDVTHPTATVVYNACYHLFRKCSYTTVHRLAWAN